MIVREIQKQPELVDDFDWYNDYDDTRQWAKLACPELVGLLDYKFNQYLKKRNEERDAVIKTFTEVYDDRGKRESVKIKEVLFRSGTHVMVSLEDGDVGIINSLDRTYVSQDKDCGWYAEKN